MSDISPAAVDASRFRAIIDLGADEWLTGLGLTADEIPHAVIVEGSWWRAQRQAWCLGLLDEVRELDPHAMRVRAYPVTVEGEGTVDEGSGEEETRVESFAVTVEAGVVVVHV